ncbi:related to RNA binding motif protein [Moesziomyces antarcticus]|uniref:Related to RNA binding motif protein n=1 Tax=Pseudozyma antarctica TaxID=84753 RepID=A0A5C3FL22_PSEA2|nr:related to RNA binding motif protein [Moesziomyces antarcticus]
MSHGSTPPATPKGASVKPPVSRPGATAATKRMATDITKWNRKQAELHEVSAASNSAEAGPSSERTSSAMEMSSEALARYDYKDLGRIACLLCQRKFKSADTLFRHESESQLHRDNLASADTCRQGVARKLEALASLTTPADNAIAVTAASSAPTQYRDRASERRAVFGTEAPPPSAASGAGKAFDAPKTVGGETVQSAPERRVGEENVGSKLLRMMGWTQGEGLGKGRQGTTEIVQTKIYRPGAGLGSAAPVPTANRPDGAESIASSRGSVTFQGYAHRARDRK